MTDRRNVTSAKGRRERSGGLGVIEVLIGDIERFDIPIKNGRPT
jgi:hypothetical protein